MARRATESDEDVNCLSNKINNLQRVFRGAVAWGTPPYATIMEA
jgi:hypothetical protein